MIAGALRMPLSSLPASRVIAVCGAAYFAAVLVLVVTRTPLGSGLFFAAAAIACAAYAVVLVRIWREPVAPRRLFTAAILLAVAFRIPPAIAPVGVDSDMVRYLWDGRVQTLGYNPYAILPNDSSLAHTHVDGSDKMPSRNDRTPYPPAAQLFFRMVVTISDSTVAMKLALVICDLLAIAVMRRWLGAAGRSEWLTLTYAWNPLVIFEVSHSGHIDALGALWIIAAAYWLTRRRTLLATLAFVLAIATKLVPVVLAPLFVGRIRRRDAAAGVAFLTLLYLPFSSGSDVPLGAVPNVVQRVRFNGPLFALLSSLSFPRMAAAVALVLAVSAAIVARLRLSADDPAAWAWPMAVAIACAPVIYPWYLLYLTPFLFTTATLPLAVWTISVLPVYEVWRQARMGGRWRPPVWVMVVEYGSVVAATLLLRGRLKR
jgi:glycosyl transferase family 87